MGYLYEYEYEGNVSLTVFLFVSPFFSASTTLFSYSRADFSFFFFGTIGDAIGWFQWRRFYLIMYEGVCLWTAVGGHPEVGTREGRWERGEGQYRAEVMVDGLVCGSELAFHTQSGYAKVM